MILMAFIILCGIKHCGKTTQGRLLAEHFHCAFYDTDDVVMRLTGKSPRQIYTAQGAAKFMEHEAAACRQIVDETPDEFAVVATGGGICNNDPALAILKRAGHIVFLQSEERTAADRIVAEMTIDADGAVKNVPAYIASANPQSEADVRALFHDFYVRRTEKYRRLADVTVDMLPAEKDENTLRIARAVRSFIPSRT